MDTFEYKLKEPIQISVDGSFTEAKSLVLDSKLLTKPSVALWLDGKIIKGLQQGLQQIKSNSTELQQPAEVQANKENKHAEYRTMGTIIAENSVEADNLFYSKFLSRLFNSGGLYYKEPHDLNQKSIELGTQDFYFILGYYAVNFTLKLLDTQG